MSNNPFKKQHGQSIDVASRLYDIKNFDLKQCRQALKVSHLQATVERALKARIKKLEKIKGNNKEL